MGRVGTALSTRVLPALGRAGSAALSNAGGAGPQVVLSRVATKEIRREVPSVQDYLLVK